MLENPLKQPPKRRLFGRQPDEDFKPANNLVEDETATKDLLFDFEGKKLNKQSYDLVDAIVRVGSDYINRTEPFKIDLQMYRNHILALIGDRDIIFEDGSIKFIDFRRLTETPHFPIQELGDVINNSDLEQIDLNFQGLRDNSGAYIADILKKSKITYLTLVGNDFGDGSAKLFADALKGSKIKKLDLNQNEIGDEGGKAFAKAIPDSNLEELILSNNNFSKEVEDVIKAACEKKGVKLWI